MHDEGLAKTWRYSSPGENALTDALTPRSRSPSPTSRHKFAATTTTTYQGAVNIIVTADSDVVHTAVEETRSGFNKPSVFALSPASSFETLVSIFVVGLWFSYILFWVSEEQCEESPLRPRHWERGAGHCADGGC